MKDLQLRGSTHVASRHVNGLWVGSQRSTECNWFFIYCSRLSVVIRAIRLDKPACARSVTIGLCIESNRETEAIKKLKRNETIDSYSLLFCAKRGERRENGKLVDIARFSLAKQEAKSYSRAILWKLE